jgi:hypothetical protein
MLRVCLIGLLALSGCRKDGSGADGDAAPAGRIPETAVADSAPPAASAAEPELLEPVEAASDGRAAPVGGNWLKCYANFQPRDEPELDVLRLGVLCGPSNGMRKVAVGGKNGGEHTWEANAGDCFRIFAVGEPSVEDLDVEVLDPGGHRLARDSSDDRWPIVKPDGPFCTVADGTHRARVRIERGLGRHALEVWRLR